MAQTLQHQKDESTELSQLRNAHLQNGPLLPAVKLPQVLSVKEFCAYIFHRSE